MPCRLARFSSRTSVSTDQTVSPEASRPARSGRVIVPASRSIWADFISSTGPRNDGLTSDGDGWATMMCSSGKIDAGAGRASCSGLPSTPRSITSACAHCRRGGHGGGQQAGGHGNPADRVPRDCGLHVCIPLGSIRAMTAMPRNAPSIAQAPPPGLRDPAISFVGSVAAPAPAAAGCTKRRQLQASAKRTRPRRWGTSRGLSVQLALCPWTWGSIRRGEAASAAFTHVPP